MDKETLNSYKHPLVLSMKKFHCINMWMWRIKSGKRLNAKAQGQKSREGDEIV